MKYLLDHFHAEPNDSMASLRLSVSKRLRLPSSSIRIEILSRHLEWNIKEKKMEMVYDLCIDTNEFVRDTSIRFLPELEATKVKDCNKKLPPVIVGGGIIGLSAALYLSRFGAKPIVLERGEETLNSNKTLQNEDKLTSYGGFHGRNGAVFIHERTSLSEDIFQRLVRTGIVQPTLKDRYIFLTPENCVLLVTNMINDIRKAGGEVRFNSEWIGCDYFLGKLKRVHYLRNGKEETIKTKELLFAVSSLDSSTVSCLANSKIEVQPKKTRIGLVIEYPYSEYKAAFLKGSRITWPNFFIDETFLSKDGRSIRFTGPYPHSEIHVNGHVANNEARLGLDGKGESTAKFILSVDVNLNESKYIVGSDGDSAFYHMMLRKDKPLSLPVEMVTDFISKREPWKLGRTKPSYKNGVFMCDLHGFLHDSISDILQYGLVHIYRNYPLFSSNNGLIYGFMESAGSPFEIFQEDYYTSKRGVFAIEDPQNLGLNLNQSIQTGVDVASFLLKDA